MSILFLLRSTRGWSGILRTPAVRVGINIQVQGFVKRIPKSSFPYCQLFPLR